MGLCRFFVLLVTLRVGNAELCRNFLNDTLSWQNKSAQYGKGQSLDAACQIQMETFAKISDSHNYCSLYFVYWWCQKECAKSNCTTHFAGTCTHDGQCYANGSAQIGCNCAVGCPPVQSTHSDTIMNEFEHQCVVKQQGATGAPHVSETQTSSILTTTTTAPILPMPTRAAGNISNVPCIQKGNSCYFGTTKLLTYEMAKEFCSSKGATLPSFHSHEDWTSFLAFRHTSELRSWLDYTLVNGSYIDSRGRQFAFTIPWCPSQPDGVGPCLWVGLVDHSDCFDDLWCTSPSHTGTVCEYRSDTVRVTDSPHATTTNHQSTNHHTEAIHHTNVVPKPTESATAVVSVAAATTVAQKGTEIEGFVCHDGHCDLGEDFTLKRSPADSLLDCVHNCAGMPACQSNNYDLSGHICILQSHVCTDHSSVPHQTYCELKSKVVRRHRRRSIFG